MILLSYIGVHQIFQLALAAEEMGALDALHCSMVNKPGKWGWRLGRWTRLPSACPAGLEALPGEKIVEHPWPLLGNRLARRLPWHRRRDHLLSNGWFDRLSARAVRRSTAKIFVGVETCALASMRAAKSRGMICVLDCPGVPVRFLDEQARLAADDLGIPHLPPANTGAMLRRKEEELRLADRILCCSDFQAEALKSQSVPGEKIRVVPLWADGRFWAARERPPAPTSSSSPKPLRVLFAGTISLKKGVPYLIEAMRAIGDDAQCLLVGRLSEEMQGQVQAMPRNCRIETYVPKDRLRELYAEHDVLVLPSLGDSFGFVGMEAMAAGMPVIASANAGVPLPDPAWRVPARDAGAIAARLRHYAGAPDELARDSILAAEFAAQFKMERYRQKVRAIFSEFIV